MNKKVLCTILLFAVACLPYAVFAQQNIQSIIIEHFDTPKPADGDNQNHPWIARGSQYASNIEGIQYPLLKWITSYSNSLHTQSPAPTTEQRSLGIYAKFDRKGYNFIELYPVTSEVDADGNPIPRGISLPGNVKILDMWIWGAGYNYTAEIQLRDRTGATHVLPIGTLNHRGWKNFFVEIPPNIPQAKAFLPIDVEDRLELRKIKIWSNPVEPVNDFYVYLDNIKVVTDLYSVTFDGDELSQRKETIELWENGVESNISNSATNTN